MKKFLFIFLIALLSCACLSCNSKKGGGNDTNSPEITEGTLLGASEIYPTVMVNGYLYEWRRLHYLPNDSIYYGDINHIDGKNPEKIVTSCLFFRFLVRFTLFQTILITCISNCQQIGQRK